MRYSVLLLSRLVTTIGDVTWEAGFALVLYVILGDAKPVFLVQAVRYGVVLVVSLAFPSIARVSLKSNIVLALLAQCVFLAACFYSTLRFVVTSTGEMNEYFYLACVFSALQYAGARFMYSVIEKRTIDSIVEEVEQTQGQRQRESKSGLLFTGTRLLSFFFIPKPSSELDAVEDGKSPLQKRRELEQEFLTKSILATQAIARAATFAGFTIWLSSLGDDDTARAYLLAAATALIIVFALINAATFFLEAVLLLGVVPSEAKQKRPAKSRWSDISKERLWRPLLVQSLLWFTVLYPGMALAASLEEGKSIPIALSHKFWTVSTILAFLGSIVALCLRRRLLKWCVTLQALFVVITCAGLQSGNPMVFFGAFVGSRFFLMSFDGLWRPFLRERDEKIHRIVFSANELFSNSALVAALGAGVLIGDDPVTMAWVSAGSIGLSAVCWWIIGEVDEWQKQKV
ncbi:MAG: hypothetical protein AAF664_17015 [Planctomycetota bacterium]